MSRIRFLLALICFFLSVNVRAQSVTCDIANCTFEEFKTFITKHYGFKFAQVSSAVPPASKTFPLKLKNANLIEALDAGFKYQALGYNINGKVIYIVAKPNNAVDHMAAEQGRLRTIKGQVTDLAGDGLDGASIEALPSHKKYVAEFNGLFKIQIPEKSTQLIVSSFGYNSQVVGLGDSSNLIVILDIQKNAPLQDSVVVIGYGSTKRSDLTGSISSITATDLGDRQMTNLGDMLKGRMPGLDISGNNIRIRGTTSFNFTEPLIVIDGFLGVSLSNVNPNDVARIEVLKDASSTAIYGARGANGVILITTKAGKEGPMKFNVNTFSGIALTTKKLGVLNAAQYNDFLLDAFKNAGQPLPLKFQDAAVRIDQTNWQDEVFRTGKIGEVNFDFSGGTEKSTFFFSTGYRHDEGITIGPKSDDIYIRNRNEFNVKKWFRAGNNFAMSYKLAQGAAPWDVKAVVNMAPYLPVYDTANFWGYSRSLRSQDLSETRNPVALSALTHPRTTTLGYNANLWAEITPLPCLVYRIQAGISGYNSLNKIWNDAYENDVLTRIPNSYTETSGYGFFPVIETYLTYKKTIDKHKFSVMAGNSWQDGAEQGTSAISGRDYTLTEIRNIFNASTRYISQYDYHKQAFLSYFGRLDYQFDNRYLLTFNMRRDGSPRFAPSHRWASFPSLALGWKLDKISAINALDVFDELKLRASIGAAGNDGIGDFRYVSPIWTNGVYYPFGQQQTLNSGATVIDNSTMDIKWESTISKTIGVDAAILNRKLEFTAEYFIKNSRDILFTVPRPVSLGYGIPPYGNGDAVVNAASCVNRGFEILLKYRNAAGKLRYSLNANFTYIHNEVTSLGLGQPYNADVNRTAVGYPIGYFYGYVADRVFPTKASVEEANEYARAVALQRDPTLSSSALDQIYYQEKMTAAGDMRFKDLNGDGKVTASDQTMIGNSIPKRQYGLMGNFKYTGFDLDIFFQGTAGYQMYYRGFETTRGMKAVQNQETYVLNRWRSELDPGNGKVPRAIIGDVSQNNRVSSMMIYDGDFLRLKQLSIGYTLNDKITRKLDVSQFRFYLGATNVFTLTHYPLYDPEYSGPNLTRGTDWLNFPSSSRTFVVGLKVTM